jgi:hypothetical protein
VWPVGLGSAGRRTLNPLRVALSPDRGYLLVDKGYTVVNNVGKVGDGQFSDVKHYGALDDQGRRFLMRHERWCDTTQHDVTTEVLGDDPGPCIGRIDAQVAPLAAHLIATDLGPMVQVIQLPWGARLSPLEFAAFCEQGLQMVSRVLPGGRARRPRFGLWHRRATGPPRH